MGRAQKPGEGHKHQRRNHHRDEVVAVEHDGRHQEMRGERRREGAGVAVAAPRGWNDDARPIEDLGQADGDDGDDEAWRLGEAAQDGQLDNGPKDGRQQQPGEHRKEVIEMHLDVKLDRHYGGDGAELRGREIDHPAGAIHEHDRHCDQRVDSAKDETGQDDARGGPVR